MTGTRDLIEGDQRAAPGRGDGRLPRLAWWAAHSRLCHLMVLALPFLVVIAGWHGLSDSFTALQGGDEILHWDVVRAVQARWPLPMVSGYGAWSGPLVYWLLAGAAAPFGGSLVATRLVVALFSWATCAVAYVIFRDRLHARPTDALALALLLAVSPFFLGQSFHVLTDNPTWFFVVLGLERLLAYVSRPSLLKLATFAACVAAASLMRHISVWLLLPGLVAVLTTPAPRGRKLAGLGLLALSIVPLAALLVSWGGLLPPGPGGVPAATPLAAHYRLRNLLLSLGVVGWYAVFLLPAAQVSSWWRRARRDRAWLVGTVVPAAAALALVAAGALGTVVSYLGLPGRVPLPEIAGAGLLWWLLIPAGAAVVAGLLLVGQGDAHRRLLLAALGGLLLSALANPRWYERYVDMPVLLLLGGLAVAASVTLSRLDRERWLLAFLVSLLAYVWLPI